MVLYGFYQLLTNPIGNSGSETLVVTTGVTGVANSGAANHDMVALAKQLRNEIVSLQQILDASKAEMASFRD